MQNHTRPTRYIAQANLSFLFSISKVHNTTEHTSSNAKVEILSSRAIPQGKMSCVLSQIEFIQTIKFL